jgi:hypothetical protein
MIEFRRFNRLDLSYLMMLIHRVQDLWLVLIDSECYFYSIASSTALSRTPCFILSRTRTTQCCLSSWVPADKKITAAPRLLGLDSSSASIIAPPDPAKFTMPNWIRTAATSATVCKWAASSAISAKIAMNSWTRSSETVSRASASWWSTEATGLSCYSCLDFEGSAAGGPGCWSWCCFGSSKWTRWFERLSCSRLGSLAWSFCFVSITLSTLIFERLVTFDHRNQPGPSKHWWCRHNGWWRCSCPRCYHCLCSPLKNSTEFCFAPEACSSFSGESP